MVAAATHMSFLFVDQITHLEPGEHAQGRCVLDRPVAALPLWLAAEAVGQLAGWVAMTRSEFRRRPVAALAGEVRVLGTSAWEPTLDLSVAVARCDEDAVSYEGQASVGGVPILQLRRCLGPMLPMEEFDDPTAVRRQFEVLRGSGRPARRVEEALASSLCWSATERMPGRALRAAVHVPVAAAFFTDHFPRRPVCPATLLLDAQCRLALELAADILPTDGLASLRAVRVRHVKMRTFIQPGQTLMLDARVQSAGATGAAVAVGATVEERRVATAVVDVAGGAP